MNGLTAIETEVEQLDNAIKASEDWSKQYRKDPESFKKIIKLESRLETILRRYFKQMAERSNTFINWYQYDLKMREVQAAGKFTIDVLIEDGPLNLEDSIFIQTMFDPIAQAVALGAQTGEKLYSVNVGMSQTSANVQRTAREQIAQLVGKSIDKNGIIIDNPKAEYRISDATRKQISESIRTSLSLGENQQSAVERLSNTIKDAKRAEMIARTEAVNAYQNGILLTGKESGAVGKEWETLGADDFCGDNQAQGIIGINESFVSGDDSPPAHPNCRCSIILIYPEDPLAKDFLEQSSTESDDE